jgi:uncharacterized protein YdiU (UPF0061 family)
LGLKEEEAIEILNYELGLLPKKIQIEFNVKMARKFGLLDNVDVQEISNAWFDYLQFEKLDFTLSFRKLSDIVDGSVNDFFPRTDLFRKFESLWRKEIVQLDGLKKKMNTINPLFIPRNHQVEKIINNALLGDFSSFYELNDVLSKPFSEQRGFEHYSHAPNVEEIIKNTFCGT